MHTKACGAHVKAAGEADGLDEGRFQAIVSVFGNVDSYGDIVMPGAFSKTLAEWAESGDPIPVLWSHRMDDPKFNIGHVLEAAELMPGDDRLPSKLKDNGGLWVDAQLDLENETAAQVWRLLKSRRVTQFSFQYEILDYRPRKDDGVWELHELKLHEVGPCQLGANQETELLVVKALAEERRARLADGKAGRVFSAKNEEALRDALAHARETVKTIEDLLAVLDEDGESEQEGSKSADPANDEEPPAAHHGETPAAKSEEPRPELRLRLLNLSR